MSEYTNLEELERSIDTEMDVQTLKELSLRLSMLMNKATIRYQDLSVAYYEVFVRVATPDLGESGYVGKFDTEDAAQVECVQQMNIRFGGVGQVQGLHYFRPDGSAGETSVVFIQRMTKDNFWADRL